MKMKIVGVKRFSGVVDGKRIDSGKVFCEVRLDDSRNSADQFAKGLSVEELRVSPELVRRIESQPLPLFAEVETERVSNGREAREVVIDIRPLEMAKVSVKAA